MRKDIWFLLLIVLAGVIYFWLIRRTPQKNSEEVEFTMNGEQLNLSSFEGNPLVVTYYAEWCGHCMKEMPVLVQKSEFFNEHSVQVVLLTDDKLEAVERVRNRFNIPYRIGILEGSIKSQGIFSIPTTYFYDSSGNQVKAISGLIDWNSEDIQQLVADL